MAAKKKKTITAKCIIPISSFVQKAKQVKRQCAKAGSKRKRNQTTRNKRNKPQPKKRPQPKKKSQPKKKGQKQRQQQHRTDQQSSGNQ